MMLLTSISVIMRLTLLIEILIRDMSLTISTVLKHLPICIPGLLLKLYVSSRWLILLMIKSRDLSVISISREYSIPQIVTDLFSNSIMLFSIYSRFASAFYSLYDESVLESAEICLTSGFYLSFCVFGLMNSMNGNQPCLAL
jgi:hypothetical protein